MRIFLLIFLLSVAGECLAQEKLTTFVLLRHAEKILDGSKDPALSEAGIKRAINLSSILGQTSIAAIYATDFIRTHSTVEPLAKSKSVAILDYEAFKAESIDKMMLDHVGRTIVVCGHSNNIPWIANYLIGSDRFKDFADDEYGNILIVTLTSERKASTVTWLKF